MKDIKEILKTSASKMGMSILTQEERLKYKIGERFDMEHFDPIHKFLEEFCQKANIESYFEVGTSEGKSLKKVIQHSKHLKRIGSCDIWGTTDGGTGRGSHQHVADLVESLGYKGEITFYDGDSHKILPTLMHHEDHFEKYDLVFVDGDHTLEGNRQDLIECWPMVKPGGWIIFDDITHPKHLFLEEVFDIWVKENLEDIDEHGKYHMHHGFGVARKKPVDREYTKKEEIKKKITSIKSYMLNKNLTDERHVDELHNTFLGETCYILGCGPSLGDVDPEKLKEITESNLTFAIKQAGLIVGHRADFQLFNCCNVSGYPSSPSTIFVGQTDGLTVERAKSRFWHNQEVNLAFNVANNKDTKNTLALKRNFDEWTMAKTWTERPFGPGIMYETVFFLAFHLGVSRIRTIGWDFQNPDQTDSWEHFYEKENRKNLLNPSNLPYPSEVRDSIELSKHFHDWFKSHGVVLEVMDSDLCFAHKDIQRYKL